jgi:LmbE family N-acetylglucosaminyl deacetylase
MIEEGEIVPYHTVPLPVSEGPWLVFAPHADDETFGMGGTLALAAVSGLATRLVVVTDGAQGGEGEGLAARREAEAQAAASALGMQSVDFMRQPDRGLQVDATTITQVQKLIEQYNPKAVFFPGWMELHPDHRTCALLVWQALQQISDPAITPVSYEISVQSPINRLVDITSAMTIKRKAMLLYASQLGAQRYERVVLAMNTLRTLTLDRDVAFAEGFFVYGRSALDADPGRLLHEHNRRLLE